MLNLQISPFLLHVSVAITLEKDSHVFFSLNKFTDKSILTIMPRLIIKVMSSGKG